MLIRLVMPGALLSLCVVVYALAMTGVLRFLMTRSAAVTILRFWRATSVLIRIALVIVSVHLVEIGIFASFFTWAQVFTDMRTSFYFSAVTYTTVGYGDPGLAREVASVCRGGRVDRDIDVRLVHGPFLRGRQPDVSRPSGTVDGSREERRAVIVPGSEEGYIPPRNRNVLCSLHRPEAKGQTSRTA